MKPVLKYRGGKGKEIPLFEKYIPSDFDTYYEPFVGGGAVYFHLEPKKAVINDVNGSLMDFYRSLKSQFPLMKEQLRQIQRQYDANQREYKELKLQNPENWTCPTRLQRKVAFPGRLGFGSNASSYRQASSPYIAHQTRNPTFSGRVLFAAANWT